MNETIKYIAVTALMLLVENGVLTEDEYDEAKNIGYDCNFRTIGEENERT